LLLSPLSGEPSGVTTVQLDGTEYRLEYEGFQKRMSFTVLGSEIDTASGNEDLAMVQWMKQMLAKARVLARRQ
jgi:hypothetical protein